MVPLRGVGVEVSPGAGSSAAPKCPPPVAEGEGAGVGQPKVVRASSGLATSGLASGFLTCRPAAGGKGGGLGGILQDQVRRWEYLERAIRAVTADKGMCRAAELYAIQAKEFPEYDEYDMDAEYPEDDAPSEDTHYTDNYGEGALVDAVQRVFSS